jgi:hypothetical protein
MREIQFTQEFKTISEQLSVATFKSSVVTCGEWRQGWATLALFLNLFSRCQKIKVFSNICYELVSLQRTFVGTVGPRYSR